MVVCKYWLEGRCRFGVNCRFEHPSSGTSSTGNWQGGGNGQRVSFQTNQYKWEKNTPAKIQEGPLRASSEIVNELPNEMKTWEQSKMWPFSCVSLEKDLPSLPEFEDLSPEELRLEAYQAKVQGAIQTHVQKFQSLAAEYQNKRQMLRQMTMDMKRKLIAFIDEGRQNKSRLPSNPGSSLLQPQASLFGGSSTSLSSQPSLFGGSSTSASGQPSLFGGSSTSASGQASLFGKPAQGAASTFGGAATSAGGANTFGGTSSVFGGAATSPTSLFGGSGSMTGQQGSVFGGASAGGGATSLFGGASQASNSSSVFGGGAGGSLFGKPAVLGNAAATTPGSLFGGNQNNNQNMSSSGMFGSGQGATPVASPGLFGAGQVNTPASGNLFGSNNNSAIATGQSSLFGGSAAGSSGQTSLFGKPVAGADTPLTSLLGANPSGSSGGLLPTPGGVGAGTGTPNLFGKAGGIQAPQNQNLFGSTPSSSSGASGLFGKGQAGETSSSSDLSLTLYTLLSELTEVEKAAFEAKDFKLGKIPLRPPPKELVKG